MRSKVNRRAGNGTVIPKITTPTRPLPFFKQHIAQSKSPLPLPHCLISAAYLTNLWGCSYLWPSACCSVAPPRRQHLHHFAPTPTYLLPPPRQCAATFRGVSLLPDPFDEPLMWNVHMPNRRRIGAVWGEVKYLQKYDLTRFIKWGKMKTKQLLVLS